MRLSFVSALLPLAGVIAGLRSPWWTWPWSPLPWLCFLPRLRSSTLAQSIQGISPSVLGVSVPTQMAAQAPCISNTLLDHFTASDITLCGQSCNVCFTCSEQKEGSDREPQGLQPPVVFWSLEISYFFDDNFPKKGYNCFPAIMAIHVELSTIVFFHLGHRVWGAFGFVQDRNPSFTAGHKTVAMLLIYCVPSWTLLSSRKMNCPAAI